MESMTQSRLSPGPFVARVTRFDKMKPLFGRVLLEICEQIPLAKPFLKNRGLRTSQEWFPARVVRVQLPQGKSFKLTSLSQNYLSFELFWRGAGYYEPITVLVTEALVASAETFIDIGANIGFYPLVLSTLQPQLEIIAFEPNPKNYQLLKSNFLANGLSRAACEPLAISDAEGTAELHLSASDMSASLRKDFDFAPGKTVRVQTTTLDNYLARRQTTGPLIIKIDAEGHEEAVLGGAEETLATVRPDIITEVTMPYGSETEALLKQAGYRFYSINDRGLVQSELLRPVIREPFVFLNYLLSTKPPPEVAALFGRIENKVRQIDLTQTSKRLEPEALERFKARQAALLV